MAADLSRVRLNPLLDYAGASKGLRASIKELHALALERRQPIADPLMHQRR